MSALTDQDSVIRFLFDNHGVRGEILRMQEPCEKLILTRNYPRCIKAMLLELAAAAELFSATLKDGSEVMVQLRCGENSPVKYALINTRDDLSFYGSAQLRDDIPCRDDLSFADLAGTGGVLVLTIFPADDPKNKWQGIVEIDPRSISATLENYFRESQQLPTRLFIWSDSDKPCAGGVMLQVIPEIKGNTESLEHLSILTQTLTEKELFSLPLTECLSRLFAHEQVRVFPPREPVFRCICSRERCVQALLNLPHAQLEEIASDNGTSMTCQHCGHIYRFSAEDLKSLLLRQAQ